MKKEVYAIPFVPHVESIHIRKDITRNPLEFVNKIMKGSKFNFGVDNITHYGYYLERGYRYDLRPFLRKFVYKRYGQWSEIYALNKKNVRQLVGRVDMCVELV